MTLKKNQKNDTTKYFRICVEILNKWGIKTEEISKYLSYDEIVEAAADDLEIEESCIPFLRQGYQVTDEQLSDDFGCSQDFILHGTTEEELHK